jgi:hypothetical protein
LGILLDILLRLIVKAIAEQLDLLGTIVDLLKKLCGLD